MKCQKDGFEVNNDLIEESGYCNAIHGYSACVLCEYCETKYKIGGK